MKIKWVFFIIWILCLVAFFNGQLFAPKDYVTTPGNPFGSLFGISFIIGVISFCLMSIFIVIDMANKSKEKKGQESKTEKTVEHKEEKAETVKNKKPLLYITGFVFIISLYFQIPQNIYKQISLRLFFNKIVKLQEKRDGTSMYSLLAPEYKSKISLNEFIGNSSGKIPYSQNTIIHSVRIDNNYGYIERTRISCYSQNCTGDDRNEDKGIKKYIYINGKWYVPESNSVYCTRTEPYPINPEFERAISLIIQRFSQRPKSLEFDVDIEKIKNCLYISYSPDAQKNNAEGLFYFDENSTNEKLNILVSDTYKANDDILTALLLTHEINHALQYVYEDDRSCFEKEAGAFYIQSMFFYALNKAEQDSLVARATVGGSSEVDQLFNFFRSVIKFGTKDPYGSMLKVVKSNPYYQKQCASN